MGLERQMAADIDGIRLDHVRRYQFAAHRIPPKSRILDAACGCGYGSKTLQNADNRVVGIDIDEQAIRYAEEHYPGPGYILGSILARPWIGVFDAIVSFETIEHIQEASTALVKFRQSLDGILIISTPNETLYPFNPANFEEDDYPHLRHYTPGEFDELLTAADFRILERHCQKDKAGEVIDGTNGKFLIYVCR